ncbi:Hypothetical predicted protein, partial [Mytilus galloprovincialis]
DGYYIYTMFKNRSQPNEETDLLSGLIRPNPKQCLTFWYHMFGEHINTLKVFQLNDYHIIELWNESANQGKKWYFQSLSLNDIGIYRIMFKAVHGNGNKNEIAIDDISITNTNCKKDDGNYLYLNASNIEPGQKSNFTSVPVSLEGDSCLTFWFHIYGNKNGTLNVYLVSENLTEKLWSRSGNGPDLWQLAFVDISMLDPYQLTFEGVRHATKRGGGISVDDISLMPGSYNKRDDGHYIYLESVNIYDIKSYLTSNIINPDGDICFTFWYYMKNYDISPLSVYTKSGNTIQMHWSQSVNNSTWTFASITISRSEPYRIIFEGTSGFGYWSHIAVDDISLLERSCSGLIKTSQKCQKIDDSISLHDCSKNYLHHNDMSLAFDREMNNCSIVYQDVQTSVSTLCSIINNSDICTFYSPEFIMEEDQRCFQSNWLSVEYKCKAGETTTVTAKTFSSVGSSAGDGTTVTTISSVINAREDISSDDTTVYAVVVSTLVIIIAVALIFTVIVCHLKKRTKSSKLCDVRPITTVTETIDSSGYNIINYNNMTGISIHEKEKNANNCQPEDIRTAIKQEDTIGNKYESLSTNRNRSEHAYESDPIHTNQYQTLTKQQESDKHFYESTETAQAQAQDNKTLTGQEDDICHKYEFLSANRNSVEHAYELDVLHTNQYESLTKQREYDKHTYESTELHKNKTFKL